MTLDWTTVSLVWPFTEVERERHVVPNEDLRPHVLAGSCWCHPTEDDEFPDLWCHNSMDTREQYEVDPVTLAFRRPH